MDHSIDYCPYVGEWEQLNADVIELKAQLTAAQAREARLRAALEVATDYIGQYHEVLYKQCRAALAPDAVEER